MTPFGIVEAPKMCRGCGRTLLPENYRVADGCPCNAPRGVNHGLVAKNTCTCAECDPEYTGSTRYPVEAMKKSPVPCPACGNPSEIPLLRRSLELVEKAHADALAYWQRAHAKADELGRAQGADLTIWLHDFAEETRTREARLATDLEAARLVIRNIARERADYVLTLTAIARGEVPASSAADALERWK